MANHLDYATPATSAGGAGSVRFRLVASVILTVLAATTCLRVEWLNHKAGGTLPKDFHGKWRVLALPERSWRLQQESVTGDSTLTTRQLTAAEQQAMNAWAEPYRADAELRDLVGSWGLLQYAIVLLGLGLCVENLLSAVASRKQRTVGITCAALLLAAGTMAVYRGYASSLID